MGVVGTFLMMTRRPDLAGSSIVAELRGLAGDSLELLREAIYDERFPALFSLEVYGSIIGMFELNNLSEHLPSLPVHAPVRPY